MVEVQKREFFGTDYVSLRQTIHLIGGEMEWDATTRQATVHAKGSTATVSEGAVDADIDGNRLVLSSPSVVVDNVIYVNPDFFTLGLRTDVKVSSGIPPIVQSTNDIYPIG